MFRRGLIMALGTTALLASTLSPALATMLTFDQAAVAKLGSQLSKLQKQVDVLGEISKKAQAQINAIGKYGQISLPIINAAAMASQLRQDYVCLKPDLSKLLPSIDFKQLNLKTVCQVASAYKQTLWLDPDKLAKLPTWKAREAAQKAVQKRREKVLADAAQKGLGLADTTPEAVKKMNAAADEVEAAGDAASSSNERETALIKGQAVLIRAAATQTQILAQMLKVQSALAIQAGVSLEDLKAPKKKGADDKTGKGGK